VVTNNTQCKGLAISWQQLIGCLWLPPVAGTGNCELSQGACAPPSARTRQHVRGHAGAM